MASRGGAEQQPRCCSCGGGPRRSTPLMRCARCKSVWYHDKACQLKDWPRHKKDCKRLAKEAAAARSAAANTTDTTTRREVRCPNEHVNETFYHDVGVTNHVVPEWSMSPEKEELTPRLTYHDTRTDNPIVAVDSKDGTKGRLETIVLDLNPCKPDDIPQIPPPKGMVIAADISSDHGVFSREEHVAMCLNAFHTRFFLQKRVQVMLNAFILLIEYDVRESESGSTLCLYVTTMKDGVEDVEFELGDSTKKIQTERRKFLFYASNGLPESVHCSLSDRPEWDIVQGLLPMGLDFILTSPYYKVRMDAAKESGRKVEIKMYCRCPVVAPAGSPQSTEEYVTKVMMWVQSLMSGYRVAVELSRLPDGITGEEEYPIETMRRLEAEQRFVGQPLLERKEDRCIPPETLATDAYEITLEDVMIRPQGA